MLNLRQAATQTLTITPQLEQAIHILQLSQQELQTEIREYLEKNPLLEADDSEDPNTTSLDAMADQERTQNEREDDFNAFSSDSPILSDDASYSDINNIAPGKTLAGSEDFTDEPGSSAQSGTDYEEVSPEQNPSDNNEISNHENDTWNENYSASQGQKRSFDGSGEEYQGETSYGLKEHLLWQLNLTPSSDKDHYIAEVIIDGVQESGYLTESNDDLLSAVRKLYPDTTMEEVETEIKIIQHFDPIGIAARSVQETLLIQLEECDCEDIPLDIARRIIENHLDLLGQRDFRALKKNLGNISDETLKQAIDIIKSLEPRPGNAIKQDLGEYIIPDVCIVRKNGIWQAELNPAAVPKLKINETYSAMIKDVKTASDSKYLKNNLQEANWIIMSLNKRNDTLLRVANCIAEEQQNFFEKGPQAMKPLILNDIASKVGLHESTVSRVTTEKYMTTPQGTFELKYFFSSSISTENGGACSSTAIRAMIKKLVDNERPDKPLSDSKLADLLKEQGIMVARRTIAKYREAINIPPSNLRKKLV